MNAAFASRQRVAELRPQQRQPEPLERRAPGPPRRATSRPAPLEPLASRLHVATRARSSRRAAACRRAAARAGAGTRTVFDTERQPARRRSSRSSSRPTASRASSPSSASTRAQRRVRQQGHVVVPVPGDRRRRRCRSTTPLARPPSSVARLEHGDRLPLLAARRSASVQPEHRRHRRPRPLPGPDHASRRPSDVAAPASRGRVELDRPRRPRIA